MSYLNELWWNFTYRPKLYRFHCGGQNCGPPKCPHPNPQNLWLCYLTCKRNLADVIKLWVLRWEIILDCTVGTMSSQGSLEEGDGRTESEKEWNIRSWNQSSMITSFEDGRGSWAKECGQLLEAGKDKETIFSQCLQKEHSPACTLILVYWDPFWTSEH